MIHFEILTCAIVGLANVIPYLPLYGITIYAFLVLGCLASHCPLGCVPPLTAEGESIAELTLIRQKQTCQNSQYGPDDGIDQNGAPILPSPESEHLRMPYQPEEEQ